MAAEKPLPCPFCGRPGTVNEPPSSGGLWFIECCRGSCRGRTVWAAGRTRKIAIRRWNTRHRSDR